ncbi:TolC family protein [Flavihumibacter petaseus]|nr:TolC family protein [Flavihumibacter petaseus]
MKQYLVLISTTLHFVAASAQNVQLSLDDVIKIAQSSSMKFKLTETQKQISYYQFQSYKSEYKPQITFYGNAPAYNKEYLAVRQPDGTIKFQAISQTNSNFGLGLSQKIALTGGEVSVNTDLTRFDDFQSKEKQFNATPIYIRLTQPLFAFNELRWKKRIEPLKFEESKRIYIEQMEEIARTSVNLFFSVLNAQTNINIASSNLQAAELNYETENKRIKLGTTTEDKILQLEMQVLLSQQNLEKAKYDLETSNLNLKTFSGLNNNNTYELLIPDNVTFFSVNAESAIEYARTNRSAFITFERRKQEAQRDMAEAKADKQQVLLTASLGYNNTGENIGQTYHDPKDQRRLNIGFNIPVVDWGRRKARFNTASALEKFTIFNNESEENILVQEIITQAKSIELLRRNIALSKTSDSVSQRRYAIATKLYQVGKLSITDLSLAQIEKDNAKRSYIDALRQFWDSYYLMRKLTLFDFETNTPLYNDNQNSLQSK